MPSIKCKGTRWDSQSGKFWDLGKFDIKFMYGITSHILLSPFYSDDFVFISLCLLFTNMFWLLETRETSTWLSAFDSVQNPLGWTSIRRWCLQEPLKDDSFWAAGETFDAKLCDELHYQKTKAWWSSFFKLQISASRCIQRMIFPPICYVV